MLTIPLFDMLGFQSVDAPSYTVCNHCGEQWYAYDDPKCSHRRYWREGEYVADCTMAKRDDYQFESLTESLDRFGITTPILLEGEQSAPIVGNGHHRIAWAYMRGVELIPVVWSTRAYWAAEDESDAKTGWNRPAYRADSCNCSACKPWRPSY